MKEENSSDEDKFKILKLKDDEFWFLNEAEKEEYHLKEK